MWTEVRQALREQYPNPQRTGCPEPAMLERLARRKMPFEEAEAWFDHFSRCSACFCDFEGLHSQVQQKRKLLWGGAAAVAVIAFCSTLALWLTSGHGKDRDTNDHTLAQVRPVPVALHFEDASSSRTTETEAETSFQHLPNKAVSLSVYLPPGSESGKYEIAMLRSRGDSAPQAKFEGKAEMEGGISVLHTSPDLSDFQPGTYVLAFRPGEGRWRYFQIIVP